MKEYQTRFAARASKVDEKSFTKHGITHNVQYMLPRNLVHSFMANRLRLEGGIDRELEPPSRQRILYEYSKEVFFNYFCRSLGPYFPYSL